MLRLLKVSPARFDPILRFDPIIRFDPVLRLDPILRLCVPRNIDFNPKKEQPYVKR